MHSVPLLAQLIDFWYEPLQKPYISRRVEYTRNIPSAEASNRNAERPDLSEFDSSSLGDFLDLRGGRSNALGQ